MQRRNEIEAKKAKLAELRKQREERELRQKELSRKATTGDEATEVRSTFFSSL